MKAYPLIKYSLVTTFLCIVITFKALANVDIDTIRKTSIDSTLVKFYNYSYDSLFLTSGKFVDTSLVNVSDRDILLRSMNLFATLSNTGLAYNKMASDPVFFNGFDMTHRAYDLYLRNSKSVRFTIPVQPFTQLYYIMGSKKEQQLNVSFGRELAPRLFVGMEYYLVNSPGPYKNSKSDNSSVYFTLRHNTKNNRYGISGHYFHNKLTMQENGGITNDSDFINNQETDRRVIGVNLTDARNQVKVSGFGFEQYFNISKPIAENDSVITLMQKFRLGRLTHRFEYQRNQTLFTEGDPLAGFYADFDTAVNIDQTRDSIFQQTIRNVLQWNTLGYKKHNDDVPFYLGAGIEHLLVTHKPDTLQKKQYSQLIPFVSLKISVLKSAFLEGHARLVTGEYGQGDLELDAGLYQYLGTSQKNLGKIMFKAHLINQEPSWKYQQFVSNHFSWDNSFKKSRFLTLTGGYNFLGMTAGAQWQFIDRYVYLDKTVTPKQFSGSAVIYSLFANLNQKIGKFDLKGMVRYQQVSNDTLIHLPLFSGKIKLTFSQDLFDKAATIQPGVIFSYFTEYYADSWMPAVREFYLQDEVKTGGYPFLDVFLALKVKRANVFLQYVNVLGLTGNYNYLTVPHYPLRDPRFYFGVSWRFYQ